MTNQERAFTAEPVPVYGASPKIAPFTEKNTKSWFRLVEQQFKIAAITNDTTKYSHVLATLTPDIIARIPDAILDKESYEELKVYINEKFSLSKQQRFEELWNDKSLIGRPSTNLSDMHLNAQQLGVGDDIVKEIFLKKVPQNIKIVMTAMRDQLDLEGLGKLADQLLAGSTCADVNKIEYNKVENSYKSRSNYGSFNREKGDNINPTACSRPGLRPFYEGQRQQVCRAHLFYGFEAKSCTDWCIVGKMQRNKGFRGRSKHRYKPKNKSDRSQSRTSYQDRNPTPPPHFEHVPKQEN